jgi:hypothetical protein
MGVSSTAGGETEVQDPWIGLRANWGHFTIHGSFSSSMLILQVCHHLLNGYSVESLVARDVKILVSDRYTGSVPNI